MDSVPSLQCCDSPGTVPSEMFSVLWDHSETTSHVPSPILQHLPEPLGTVPKATIARGLLLTGLAKVSSSSCGLELQAILGGAHPLSR